MLDACPKCGSPRARAETRGACPTCGLRLDLWETFEAKPPEHPVLDAAFEALRSRFDEQEAHDAFIALARTEGLLDLAAARYRLALKDHADQKALIDRALTQIAFIATQETNAAIGDGATRGLRGLKIAATLVAVLLFCVVGSMLWRIILGKRF